MTKEELTAGLEIHQQLDTHKLFCSCPSILRSDKPQFTVQRKLNPVVGETGEIDVAASYEKQKNETFVYQVYDTNCLVELDEEPPHEINQEALKIAIQIASLLNCEIFPVTQIMRKTVINGSNTSGFQRTTLIAHDGFVETTEGKVRIETIALEEDSARPASASEEDDPELENSKIYKLDRLGIPLVEITTAPDMHSPEQIKETALKIGEILRACKVKRGIGTIRQDVNISITDGNRIEIKGFQDPKIMIQTILNEMQRQKKILELRSKFKKAKLGEVEDITKTFEKTTCKFMQKKKIFGFKVSNLDGVLGEELQPAKRVGTDFSDYAKPVSGIGGIIHSDENLEKYTLTEKEISETKKSLDIKSSDAFILIVGTKEQAEKAHAAIEKRILLLSEGVPKEVRNSNPDATTTFLRPMPGSARMYPETDHPLVKIKREFLDEIKKNLPKLASENKKYLQEFGLNSELVALVLQQNKIDDFKYLIDGTDYYDLVAKCLTLFPTEIAKKENVPQEKVEEILNIETLAEILDNVPDKISPNDVKTILSKLVRGESLENAIKKSNIDLKSEAKKIIAEKPNLSQNAYMGLLMSKFKGQVSGKEVSEVLKEIM